jgi:hypothetical protein
MRNTLRTLVILILVVGTLPGAAGASEPVFDARDVPVTIRTYQGPFLTPAHHRSALAIATEILKAAGLGVQWRICEDGIAQDSDPCSAPLGPNELAIRFARQPLPPNYRGPLPLGYAVVDTQARSGSLATIYVDRVDRLARDSGTRTDALLGRSIAHEIGHLLLGTTSHTPTGLMRAIWSSKALQRNQAGDWLFTPHDARSMRDALFLDQH